MNTRKTVALSVSILVLLGLAGAPKEYFSGFASARYFHE